MPDELCTSCCIHLSRASQQLMWCVEFSGLTGGLVTSRSWSCVIVVCCGGRMRCLETTPECERMLPRLAESVFCVKYDATDFCRVFLLANCVMWLSLYSRKEILAAPKKNSNAECLSSLGGPNYVASLLIISVPGRQKTLYSLWFEHKYG